MVLSGDVSLPVICDWFDLTCPPWVEDEVSQSLTFHMIAMGFDYDEGKGWRHREGGFVTFGLYRKVFRLSCSGGALAQFRQHDSLNSIVALFIGYPHRVTRLDAAADFEVDGADVLEALHERFPRHYLRLGRRAQRMSTLSEPRGWDDRVSGTIYVGNRRTSQISCRVYDKRKERVDRTGLDPEVDWTRVEITMKGKSGDDKSGPTLRDIVEPQALFWTYADPNVVQCTGKRPERLTGFAEGWKMEKVELLPAQVIKGRMEHFDTLDKLVQVADHIGIEGRRYLKSQISQYIDRVPVAEDHSFDHDDVV